MWWLQSFSSKHLALGAAQAFLHERMFAFVEMRLSALSCTEEDTSSGWIRREKMFLLKEKLWLARMLQEEQRQLANEREAQAVAVGLGRNGEELSSQLRFKLVLGTFLLFYLPPAQVEG